MWKITQVRGVQLSIHDMLDSSYVTSGDLPSIVTRWKTGLVKLSEEVKNDSNDLWQEKSKESANPLYNDLATFLVRLLNETPRIGEIRSNS